MAVTIQQTNEAAFPDRARDGLGMRVHLTDQPGADSLVLEHHRLHPVSELHVRVMLAIRELPAGAVTLMRGLNPLGRECFDLVCHAQGPRIELRPAWGESIMSAPLVALPWHCVEMRVSAAQGEVELRVDGRIEGSVTVSPAESHRFITQTILIGGVSRDSQTTGAVDLDEWIVAGQPIGPVCGSPSSAHADDPARWLVIYNRDLPDSVAWAHFYQQHRAIPFANLLGLSVSSAESIPFSDYLQIMQSIEEYLLHANLKDQIVGILLGFGVPGYVNHFGSLIPTGSLLHRVSSIPGPVYNPLAWGDLVRPTIPQFHDARFTARIDAPHLQAACAITERSLQLEQDGLSGVEFSTLHLNAHTIRTGQTSVTIDNMLAWSADLDASRLRIPLDVNAPVSDPMEAPTQVLQRDGFFWGWCLNPQKLQFADDHAGTRVLLAPFRPDGPTCHSLRIQDDDNVVLRGMASGYLAAIGGSGTWSMSAFPVVSRFFNALRNGWTLAEAYLVASPVLRENLFLIGDPLMRVPMPRAGFDVLGPAARTEELEVVRPVAILRSSQHDSELPVTARPSNQAIGVCQVRRVDELGRSELGCEPVRFAVHQSRPQSPPLLPIWPCHENWRVPVRNSRLHLYAKWDRPLTMLDGIEIRLLSQVGDQIATVRTWPTSDRRDSVGVELPLPPNKTRFTWELQTRAGVIARTDWSEWVTPTPAPTQSLTLLEAP